ncbi:glycoside hydrolase family 3 N-terminal domain-containing protein [Gaoshiqia sp. Z1-71]|uniref:glycoside hydrolase family 3 N-terminal domain-containing protein n=1 Tax=Gaoshiqia hydrogeniformans TaxID=3290090 RepID=UPI003BF7AAC9
MTKLFSILLILTASASISRAQFDPEKLLDHPWVDSVYHSLTPDQRIAQLIWVYAAANHDVDAQFKLAEQIKKYNLGGVIFFSGDPEKQARLTNLYQSAARTPLFIAMDAEWGVGMRLPGVISFPYQMMMGASSDPELIRQATAEMARQMKRLGVQVSLGPVADINTEPLNPIIGMRSFGESPQQVTAYALAYMQGLQENGIMAVAKHFPGHGDTRTDSHLTLPRVPWSRERLDSTELYPFRRLARQGIAGLMTAHLNVPALDPQDGIPASLSPKIIQGIIRDEWQYRGLVITDAMNMAGALSFGKAGEIEALALKAGNDVVEFPKDPELSIAAIKKALENNNITWDEINRKCRRVLAAKYWAGLHQLKPVELPRLTEDLNAPPVELAKRRLIEASLTLLENQDEIIPLKKLDTLKIACLSVGSESLTPFQRMLANYAPTTPFNLHENFSDDELNRLKEQLNDYNLVIAGFHLYESKGRKSMQVGNLQRLKPERPYGMTDATEALLAYLAHEKTAIEVLFSSPYALAEVQNFGKPAGLVMAFQNDSLVQELAAQLVFGGIGTSGKLPVSLGSYYAMGDGYAIAQPVRLKYTIPEEAGINSFRLTARIDSIVEDALHQKAFPGCQVFVAKDGKVIFQKAYGYHTFEQRVPVRTDDLYDLASVTKISGGLPAILKLYDEGKIELDQPVANYFPDWKKRFFHPSDKNDITVRELYAHQSGLVPFIGFWKKTLKDGGLSARWYSLQADEKHTLCVAPGMYLNNRFPKIVNREIRKTPLKNRGRYVYSDLPLVITPQIVEYITGVDFNSFVENHFYRPLGADALTYNPLERFSRDRIVPTEDDRYYRFQLVQGTVHDESAAVLGGISGNAGLFASANDLAKLMQLYLQTGTYGGESYLSEATMKEFTRVQFPGNNNRRGLVFDKPLLDNAKVDPKKSYPCPGAGPESFGHSGFTGTFVWIDPVHQLSYIFLSNRVYPTRDNNKLGELNVRTNILQALYDEINADEW